MTRSYLWSIVQESFMKERISDGKLKYCKDDIQQFTAHEAVEVDVVLVVDILAEELDQCFLLFLLFFHYSSRYWIN